jgi:branched-chain amino acid transport system ATP-binding protein
MDTVLEAEGLDAYYGRARILFGVGFALRQGEVVALLGRNGAGKSTTLRALMGVMPRMAGRIALDGRSIAGLPSHAIARLGLGYVPEDRRCFSELTVLENLEVGRQPPRPGIPAWDEARVFALFPHLEGLRHRLAGRMSGGEQQMLTIARTLMGNPRVILLDEPSEGLAPVVVEQMAHAIATLQREGLTVLLCEQNLRFATRVSNRALIMEKGEVRYDGAMAALAADEATRRAYLTV